MTSNDLEDNKKDINTISNKKRKRMQNKILYTLLLVIIITVVAKEGNATSPYDGLIYYASGNSSLTNSTNAIDSSGFSTIANLSIGLYNSVDQAFNFTNNQSILNVTNSSIINSCAVTKNCSMSFWIKANLTNQNSTFPGLIQMGTGNSILQQYIANSSKVTDTIVGNGTNTSDKTDINLIFGNIDNSTWTHVFIDVDSCANGVSGYLNGQKNRDNTLVLTNCTGLVNLTTIIQVGKNFQGLMRQIQFFNTTKNDTEVYQIYSAGPYGNATIATISLNYSQRLKTLSNDTYCVNLGTPWGGTPMWIDAVGNDTTSETASNYSWHRTEILAAGIKCLRVDMALDKKSNNTLAFNTNNNTNNGNINSYANLTEWAYQNNITISFIADYTPSWLATNGSTCTTTQKTCMPSDLAIWGNLVVAFLNNVTNYGQYNSTVQVEVWDEADLPTFFLSDVAASSSTREANYTMLYNYTRNAIIATYPNMKVGFEFSSMENTNSVRFTNAGVGNQTTNMSFFGPHFYWNIVVDVRDSIFKINTLLSELEKILTSYGASTVPLSFGEINQKNTNPLFNNTNLESVIISSTYQSILSSPYNVTNAGIYQWTSYTENSSAGEVTSYNMVSEPSLGSYIKSSYYALSNMSHAHTGGSSIYNLTSTDPAVTCTFSENSTNKTVSCTNTADIQKTINMTLAGISNAYFLGQTTGIRYSFDRIYSSFPNLILSNESMNTFNIETDSTAPTMNVSSPTQTMYTSNNVTVTFNASDSQTNVSSLWYSNDSISNTTFLSSITVIESYGTHTYTFYANDSYGNIGSTTVTFTVQSPASVVPCNATSQLQSGLARIPASNGVFVYAIVFILFIVGAGYAMHQGTVDIRAVLVLGVLLAIIMVVNFLFVTASASAVNSIQNSVLGC